MPRSVLAQVKRPPNSDSLPRKAESTPL